MNDKSNCGSLLDVREVTIRYKTQKKVVTATDRVSFSVAKGERYVIVGASGCGKSTLLKAIGGYVDVASGRIELRGSIVKRPGVDRIMVFQEFDQLLPWKTVRENVAFALKVGKRMDRQKSLEVAEKYIEKVGLQKFSNQYPHTLSGGMKQRVAIARGLAMEPEIILMDEPFAALDALTRREMQEELLRLWEEFRITVLFVTHSIEEAIFIGNKVLVLSPHPGRVKGELKSDGNDVKDAEGVTLSTKIRELLYG